MANRRPWLAVIAVLLAGSVLVAACHVEPRPPDTTATAGGTTAQMGIGSYCWDSRTFWGSVSGLCVDTAGLVTRGELTIGRGEVVSVSVPSTRSGLTRANVSSLEATGREQELEDGRIGWPDAFNSGPAAELPFEIHDGQIRIRPDLPAGRYILTVGMWFEHGGDVFYGVVLDVQ
jgi:hypothetical protein